VADLGALHMEQLAQDPPLQGRASYHISQSSLRGCRSVRSGSLAMHSRSALPAVLPRAATRSPHNLRIKKQHNQRADHRHDDTCGMHGRVRRWLIEKTRNVSADKGADDAEYARHDDPHVSRPRKDQARDRADDYADDEHPQVVQQCISPG